MMLPGRLMIATDAVGGVWSYSVALARGLAAGGQSCILAVLGPAPNEAQMSEVSRIGGCSLVETGLPLEWMLDSRTELDRLVASLIGVAEDCAAAAVHLHAPALACLPWPMPVVAVAHSCMATWWDEVRGGVRPSEILWHVEATQQGLLTADTILAPSEAFGAALHRAYHLTRPPIIVRNGLPEPVLHHAARESFLLTAGRLWDPAKNVAVLDAAAVLSHHPIRAAGPLGQHGSADIDFEALHLLGRLAPDQLGDLMERAAIFVSSSLYEPFGLAVLEAAQRGTPLMLSDIPSFRELWHDAALFVPANDPSAWATEIDTLMDDDDLRMRLGTAAYDRSRHYTQDAMVRHTADIHRTLSARVACAA